MSLYTSLPKELYRYYIETCIYLNIKARKASPDKDYILIQLKIYNGSLKPDRNDPLIITGDHCLAFTTEKIDQKIIEKVKRCTGKIPLQINEEFPICLDASNYGVKNDQRK